MTRKGGVAVTLVSVLGAFVIACSDSSPTEPIAPSPTPTATATPVATKTPTPVATATPAPTSVPTKTPTPAASLQVFPGCGRTGPTSPWFIVANGSGQTATGTYRIDSTNPGPGVGPLTGGEFSLPTASSAILAAYSADPGTFVLALIYNGG